jgi:hypothetical protein
VITELPEQKWNKNGWMTNKGTPVEHQDVIKYILAMLDVRKLTPQRFVMMHVKHPRTSTGFCEALTLATRGQTRSDIPPSNWDELKKNQERALDVSRTHFVIRRGSHRKFTEYGFDR